MENDIVTFKLHLQGPTLGDHSIDAKEFGTALIGLEEILDIITSRLVGARQKSQLRVQADLQQGSLLATLKFIVEAVGCSPTLFSDTFSVAKNGLECLTLLAQLRKEFQDQPVGDNDVARVASGMTFNNCVINNFSDQSKSIAQQIHNTGTAARPLKTMFSPLAPNHQVNKMELLDTDGNPFIQSDKKGYDAMFTQPAIETPAFPIMSRLSAELLGIRFDDKTWVISDNGNRYTAKVTDADFLQRVENAEISFSVGMTAVVDLQPKPITKNGKTVSTCYEITKVYDVLPKESGNLF